jgi:hypothetical protein
MSGEEVSAAGAAGDARSVRRRIALLVACAAVAAAGAVVSGAGAAPRDGRTPAAYLALAQAGLADVQSHWWDAQDGWYYDTFGQQPAAMPLARLWSAYPLFETFIGVAVAQPTPSNRAALETFADQAARRYWNDDSKPGGYDWYPAFHAPHANLYFDDSGWFGLSFIETYAATGKARYLTDARRALSFIVRAGWDAKRGGVWWDMKHEHKTIEPVAAAVMIATRLYRVQHRASDLRWALKLLSWANAHSFNRSRGLYQRNSADGTVMDYVQGLMITANWELCKMLHRPAMCTKARQLANAALAAFPHALDWVPQYDVVYLRWMLEYYRESGDVRFHQLAVDNAERAIAARNESGYYLNNWDGKPIADGLEEEAANLELFAWLAARPAAG